MKIVGAVGHIGSGKDTIIQYISKKCSMPILLVGDLARNIARNDGLPETRENLQKITEKYYEKFGRNYFIDETIRKIKRANHGGILITGVRAPTDVTTLRKQFHDDFILLCDTAPRKMRFQRLLARREPLDPKTSSEFLRQDEMRKGFSSLPKHANLRIPE